MNWQPIAAIAAGLLWAAGQFPVAQAADRGEGLVTAFVQTKRCMRSAGIAAVERGNDAASTQYFMLSVCGDKLLAFMRVDMAEEEAKVYLLRIARTTYYEDVLRIPEPSLIRK